nr:unnamed protein product [uncultured bacterium]
MNINEIIKKSTTDIAESVTSATLKNLKIGEQNFLAAEKKFLEVLKSGKEEVAKAVTKQRLAIFKTVSNCLAFILIGVFASFIGIFGYNFFKIQNGFFKELAETKKLESIRKEAVDEYKQELMNPDGKELAEIAQKWKKKYK